MAQAQVLPSACAASPSRGTSCSARPSGMRAEGACSATALRTCATSLMAARALVHALNPAARVICSPQKARHAEKNAFPRRPQTRAPCGLASGF